MEKILKFFKKIIGKKPENLEIDRLKEQFFKELKEKLTRDRDEDFKKEERNITNDIDTLKWFSGNFSDIFRKHCEFDMISKNNICYKFKILEPQQQTDDLYVVFNSSLEIEKDGNYENRILLNIKWRIEKQIKTIREYMIFVDVELQKPVQNQSLKRKFSFNLYNNLLDGGKIIFENLIIPVTYEAVKIYLDWY